MSNINLEDMTELINVFDGYNRLTNIAYDLLGMNSSDGKSVLSEIAKVISVIERHSTLFQSRDNPSEDYIETLFWKTLNDGSLTAEERAAKEREEEIRRLEKEMQKAAKMLEFEYAAVLRDRLVELRNEKQV